MTLKTEEEETQSMMSSQGALGLNFPTGLDYISDNAFGICRAETCACRLRSDQLDVYK